MSRLGGRSPAISRRSSSSRSGARAIAAAAAMPPSAAGAAAAQRLLAAGLWRLASSSSAAAPASSRAATAVAAAAAAAAAAGGGGGGAAAASTTTAAAAFSGRRRPFAAAAAAIPQPTSSRSFNPRPSVAAGAAPPLGDNGAAAYAPSTTAGTLTAEYSPPASPPAPLDADDLLLNSSSAAQQHQHQHQPPPLADDECEFDPECVNTVGLTGRVVEAPRRLPAPRDDPMLLLLSGAADNDDGDDGSNGNGNAASSRQQQQQQHDIPYTRLALVTLSASGPPPLPFAVEAAGPLAERLLLAGVQEGDCVCVNGVLAPASPRDPGRLRVVARDFWRVVPGTVPGAADAAARAAPAAAEAARRMAAGVVGVGGGGGSSNGNGKSAAAAAEAAAAAAPAAAAPSAPAPEPPSAAAAAVQQEQQLQPQPQQPPAAAVPAAAATTPTTTLPPPSGSSSSSTRASGGGSTTSSNGGGGSLSAAEAYRLWDAENLGIYAIAERTGLMSGDAGARVLEGAMAAFAEQPQLFDWPRLARELRLGPRPLMPPAELARFVDAHVRTHPEERTRGGSPLLRPLRDALRAPASPLAGVVRQQEARMTGRSGQTLTYLQLRAVLALREVGLAADADGTERLLLGGEGGGGLL
jgi:hypothetical protein